MERIRNAYGTEIAVDAVHGKVELTITKSESESQCGTVLSIGECQAVQDALAYAQTVADVAPAPEQPEAEAPGFVGTVIELVGGDKLVLRCGTSSAELTLSRDMESWKELLTQEEAAQLCDALTAFVKDGEEPADEPKPAAEVIAERNCVRIVVIDGGAFQISDSAQCNSRELSRKEAQLVMLRWGGDPAEVQAATQAIEA